MKTKILIILIPIFVVFIYWGRRLYEYYSPAKERPFYWTSKRHDDTLRIAYIGDSWAFGHSDSWTFGSKPHTCRLSDIIKDSLHKPVIVES